MVFTTRKLGLLFSLLINVIRYVTSSTCPTGTVSGGAGICYKYYPETKAWSDANNYCKATHGGTLIIVNTVNVFNVLANLIKTTSGLQLLWVGASDSDHDKNFNWVDGQQCCPNRWVPGQPDGSGQCLDMWHTSSGDVGFDDGGCGAKFKFVCQAPACRDIPNCLPGHVQCTGPSESQNQCTKCDIGFFAAGLGKGCIACRDIPNCLPGHVQCTGPSESQNQCTKCDIGFFAAGLGKGCIGCKRIDDCEIYECVNTTTAICTKCLGGQSKISGGLFCYEADNLAGRFYLDKEEYLIYDDNNPESWHNAEEICKFEGGNLFVPEAMTVEREVRYHLQSIISSFTEYKFWIGGRLINSTAEEWIGTSQSNVFTRWGHRPSVITSELCIAMDQTNEYKITALPCQRRHPFICQKKSTEELTVG